jgi:hypothetical protein
MFRIGQRGRRRQNLLDDQALWPEVTQAPYRVSWSRRNP